MNYNSDYCGVSSSPDHRVESVIEFRKVVFSLNGDVMAIAHWFASYNFDVAIEKFDFAPVQSPDVRSSRCKQIIVQGDEPQKLSVNFYSGVKGAILGSKLKK